jgi:hypothetical protein
VHIAPLLLESSVDSEFVGIECGGLSCGGPPDFLYPKEFAQCAIDNLDLKTSERVETPIGAKHVTVPTKATRLAGIKPR